VLAAHAPTQDLTMTADEILVRNGAHARRTYGKLSVEILA